MFSSAKAIEDIMMNMKTVIHLESLLIVQPISTQ